MDFEEEENKGYNMRGNALKGPGKQAKSHFEVYKDDVDEDIVEEIESNNEDHQNQNKLH